MKCLKCGQQIKPILERHEMPHYEPAYILCNKETGKPIVEEDYGIRWKMRTEGETKQEKIREGMARRAYIWDFMRRESYTLPPFETLTEVEQKPYYVLADELMIGLLSQEVVIKVERELPEFLPEHDFFRNTENTTKQKMLNAGYAAVEPLIKEGSQDADK